MAFGCAAAAFTCSKQLCYEGRPPKIDAFRLSNEQTKTGGEGGRAEGPGAGAGAGEERRAVGRAGEGEGESILSTRTFAFCGPFYTQAMGEISHACFVYLVFPRLVMYKKQGDGSRSFTHV